MAIQFGKREQIVVIALSGLAIIGGLHLLVFSGRASDYKAAHLKLNDAKGRINNVITLSDAGQLERLKAETKKALAQYDDAITSLRLVKPPEFEVPLQAADVVLDPPPDLKTPPDVIAKMKEADFPVIVGRKLAGQVQLILNEIKKLQARDKRKGGAAASSKTEMLFLGDGLADSGWKLPVAMPENIRGGRMEDTLREVDQTLGTLKIIEASQVELRAQQRADYERYLGVLGINNAVYLDASPAGLAVKGEYVPLIHKLCHLMLLEEALGPDKTISGKKVTRDLILSWLEISLPYGPLPGSDLNELFFIYFSLHYLNELLDLMVEHEIAQVFGVTLEGVSYLGEQTFLLNPDLSAPAPTPVPPRAHITNTVINIENFQPPVYSPAGPTDLAYAIPISVQFRANNQNAWNMLHAFLRKAPLNEIDEMKMAVASDQGDIYFQVRFLFVPVIFAAKPKVIASTLPTPTPPPPPAGEAAPDAPEASGAAPAAAAPPAPAAGGN